VLQRHNKKMQNCKARRQSHEKCLQAQGMCNWYYSSTIMLRPLYSMSEVLICRFCVDQNALH